jgi:hypothetical protein
VAGGVAIAMSVWGLASSAAATYDRRIDVGSGSSYTDSLGRTWQPQTAFTTVALGKPLHPRT